MRKRNNMLGITAVLAVMFAMFAGLFGGEKASAQETNKTQKVTIHKLVFDKMPKDILNSGDEMTFENSKPLNGAVFTAYDATEAFWTGYENPEKGMTPEESGKKKVLQAEADKLTSYDFPPSGTTKDGQAGNPGEASLDLPITSGGKPAAYLIVETTTPQGVVGKSVDFVLGLPSSNDEGTIRKQVHVYPKNEYKTSTLEFTKYGVDRGENSGAANHNALEGTKFILEEKGGLFYNPASNKFDLSRADAEKNPLISGEDGKVKAENLTLKDTGDYYFYEIDSDVSTSKRDLPEEPDMYHFYGSADPLVIAHAERDSNSNMTITYDYSNDKIPAYVTEQKIAKAYNYKVPAPQKEVDDSDVQIGTDVKFTITQVIPLDVAEYEKFVLADTPSKGLEVSSTVLDDVKNSIKVDGKTLDEAKITADVTEIPEEPDKTEKGFQVTFPTSSIHELEAYAGKKITFEVTMKLTKDAAVGSPIKNTITFNNNFQPKHDDASVTTHGKTFIKKDEHTDQTLNGAKFIVKKGEEYLQIDKEGNVSWGTYESSDLAAKDDKVKKYVSGENGNPGEFTVSGIDYADDVSGEPIDYELIETEAPDGYIKLKDSIHFKADNGQTDISPQKVTNKTKGLLPSTGGVGFGVLVIGGIALISLTGVYFSKRRHQM